MSSQKGYLILNSRPGDWKDLKKKRLIPLNLPQNLSTTIKIAGRAGKSSNAWIFAANGIQYGHQTGSDSAIIIKIHHIRHSGESQNLYAVMSEDPGLRRDDVCFYIQK